MSCAVWLLLAESRASLVTSSTESSEALPTSGFASLNFLLSSAALFRMWWSSFRLDPDVSLLYFGTPLFEYTSPFLGLFEGMTSTSSSLSVLYGDPVLASFS